MFTSRKFYFLLIFVLIFSIFLTFLPLLGGLGYEYSVISAIVLSFISVFLAAEYMNDSGPRAFIDFNVSDKLASLILLSAVLVLINFLIGFFSSIIGKDCSVSDGIKFYILITVVSVFFATCLGLLTGTIFGKRGFFIGSIILILTIVFSLWQWYHQLPLFLYSPVFAYFPGPLYDRMIPITDTLIIYRLRIVVWAFLFLSAVHIIYGFRRNSFGTARFLSFVVLLLLLVASYYKQEDIGITHSRKYIKDNFLTETFETDNFSIHYAPGTWEDKNIELIAKDHEWRYFQLEKYLDTDLDNKINVYIYPDKDTRKKLFGSYDTTVANPIHQEIHLVYKSFPHKVLKHELVHVMSSEFGSGILKISPKKGLIEGLAVAADWGGEGLNRHQWSKTILLNNENINIQDLLGYRFFYEPASTSYTLMGSFSKFLIDKYGIEKFKNFYYTGDTGVYNLTEEELVSIWVKFLNEEIELPKNARKLSEYKFSEKSLFDDTCPRETEFLLEKGSANFKNKNYKNAVRYFKKANNINKNNPNTLSALAYAYYYDGNYDELMNLETDSLSEVDSNIVNNLRYNVFWDRNGYNYAYNFFKKLSQKALPEDIKRSLDIKLELRNFNPNIRELYKEYIKKGDKLNRVVSLEELISEYRSFSPGYYLLGRIFLQNGDYIRAKKNFSIAERKGLPTLRLRKENLKLLGISLYASGNYLEAKKRFEDLIKIDSEKTYSNLATDFINRSEWALQN